MKKLIYAILACIIIAGVVVTLTIGLKVDLIYSKNAEIDIYVKKIVNIEEIRKIAKEVFPNEKVMVNQIELFEDMVAITITDRADENLKDQVEQLKTKINEKYGSDIETSDVTIVHNSKVKLSSIIKPYIAPISISAVIILVYVIVRYRKLGIIKTGLSYILYAGAVQAVFFGILAISRFSINRFVVPVVLMLYIITITALSFKNEKKLETIKIEEKEK